jgi:hypothetical protein
MADDVGGYYDDWVLGYNAVYNAVYLKDPAVSISACNLSVEAAVFSEMFMVTRMYGVADVW